MIDKYVRNEIITNALTKQRADIFNKHSKVIKEKSQVIKTQN